MLTLAVEQSSDTGGIAILDDGKILGEREWDGLVLRSCGLFACLKDLLAATALNLKDISRYVVDVGPGSYSGLRSSFAAVRAFALPDGKPIYALTSAETIAFEIMNEFMPKDLKFDKVQVVGDARRRQLWTGVYQSRGDILAIRSKLGLVNENELQAEPGAIIVSPDWHRIGEKLKGLIKLDSRFRGNDRSEACMRHSRPDRESRKIEALPTILINERKVPKAGWLGKLAGRKMRLNIRSEPLTPVYLHAAVKE